jgi:hypothetical protein
MDLIRADVARRYRSFETRGPFVRAELEQLVEHLLTPRFAAWPSPEHVNLLP